jgi:ubiquinone/menaquinone biosynthesis C-methylase UbiE
MVLYLSCQENGKTDVCLNIPRHPAHRADGALLGIRFRKAVQSDPVWFARNEPPFDGRSNMTHDQLADYYARRAAEYERIYLKPERQANLQTIQTRLAECFHGLDLLEIACGTGYWTQFAARSARSITAIDFNQEVLNIAGKKDYGKCPVALLKSDAYALDEINGSFSAALSAFWWSHVPKSKIAGFLRLMHSKLRKGATVVILDNRYVEGSSTPIARTDQEGNSYQIRSLADGSRHEVLKNFTTRGEFLGFIEPISEKCSFTEMDYFWLAEYTCIG